MKTVTAFKGHLPTINTLSYQGPAATFQLVGRDFVGLRLQDAHRHILNQIASTSAFAGEWRPAKVSNVQFASGLSEQQILIAAADLQEKGLVVGLIFKNEAYIAPTELGAENLVTMWNEGRLLVEDNDR